MFISNLAAFACWIITAYANTKWTLYTSYLLQGLFGAVAYNSIGEAMISLPNVFYICTMSFRSLHCWDSTCVHETYSGALSDSCCMPWLFIRLHLRRVCLVEDMQTRLGDSDHFARIHCRFTVQGDTPLACEKGYAAWGNVKYVIIFQKLPHLMHRGRIFNVKLILGNPSNSTEASMEMPKRRSCRQSWTLQ